MKRGSVGFNLGALFIGVIIGLCLYNPAVPFIKSQLPAGRDPARMLKNMGSDGPESLHRQAPPQDLVKIFPTLITRQGSSSQNYVALTFDDGPDLKYTPKILDTLKKFGVKATFFLIGAEAEKYPAIVKRMVNEGHEIASHGYTHKKISDLNTQAVKLQLQVSGDVLKRLTGKTVKLFRPPYGALDVESAKIIGKQGFKVILWTVDSLDWRSIPKDKVVSNVVPGLKNGIIVLQHSAGAAKQNLSGSVEALPEIIKQGKARGLRFITISQLMAESAKKS